MSKKVRNQQINMHRDIHTYISRLISIVHPMVINRAWSMKIVFVGAVIIGGLFVPHSGYAQVTLSGTLYSDAGVTPQSVSKFIAVAVGTSTPSVFASTTLTTTGAWTVTIPAGHGIGTSTPIIVWVNDDATIKASVLTKASSSASVQTITGLDLYQSRVIARHEASSGTSTTFADFAFYTSAQDSDLQHSTSSGLLTIAPGNELYIWGGDTFAPGSSVRVLGNASASSTDGSMYLGANSVYTAGGALQLAGSLTAVSSATFTGGVHTTTFNATTTGKTINAPIASLGNVTFNGAGGAWSFSANATTTNFTVLQGTVSTPGVTVGVTGTYQNDATFNAGSGALNIVGATTPVLADFISLTTARDAAGMVASTSPTSTTAFAIAGNTLYIAKAGGSQGCGSTASTTAGNCELMVYNIASTTNPVYVTARDSGGSNASTSNVGINALFVSGNMLYVAKAGSAVPCTQVAGTATGCEIMVFDISSTTDPIYRAGRDADGSTTGTSATSTTDIKVSGSALYVSKAAGATTCSASTGAGAGACEILIFNISSTTNPQYIAGLDAAGNTSAGAQALQVNNMEIVGSTLYAVKAGSATTCNPTVGNAVGCELMVFNIASTTAPVFATGRDAGGSNASTSAIAMNFVVGTTSALYIGKAGSAVPCTGVAGTADGCGVMVFDISSTTDPIYRRGIDAGGSYTGIQALNVNGLTLHKNYLYVAKAASAVPCDSRIGLAVGCELVVLDVASSTAIRMVAGRDAGGDAIGLQSLAINALIGIGDTLYAGKAGVNTSCTATAGNAVGCELMVFDISRPASGLLLGTMVATSTLGDVTARGVVEFRDMASTSDLTIASGTTTMPTALTVAGDYTNNAILTANEGTLYFASNTAQTISGTLVGTSSLYRTIFAGSGTKTIGNIASTSFFEVMAGATVVAPSYLTVADTFTNNGTFDANNGTLYSAGYFNEFLGGASTGGSMIDSQGIAINNLINVGDIVYVAKAGNGNACSQVAGSAVGCELLVFDVSNPNNIVYRAGRDASGSTASTSATSTTAMAIAGNTLYVAKAGGSQGCTSTASTTAGNCELLVFDISSTTNPIFVTARDAGGSSASTSNIGINQLIATGGMLYVAKAGSAVPCTQVAGTADGCELMVFDISSTTNPTFVVGRDVSGNNTGTGNLGATSLAVASSTLYVGKLGSATTCNPTAGSATDCELMVFDISSTTNPTFITARDSSGSNASTSATAINSIIRVNDMLYVAKAASGAGCAQTAGSAAGCELMVFDISSTTNPTFRAGRDASGNSNGTGNIAANFVTASGTNLYLAKAGDTTVCSQAAGSAVGCEIMLFDIGSSTNPVYTAGRDVSAHLDGRANTSVPVVSFAGNSLLVGKANDPTPCEQIRGLRIGCELLIFKSPMTFTGTLTGNSDLATVTTNGLTKILAAASTTHLTVATSSVLTAPAATLSASGNVRIQGAYQHNNGELALVGTNQLVSGVATTTFYDFTQRATAAATTTFSTTTPFVVVRNLTLRGASAGAPLILRSASTTAQWSIDPQSSSTITLEFLDVQDSNNISATTTPLTCSPDCIDRGNNTNWTFPSSSYATATVSFQDGINSYTGTRDTYIQSTTPTTAYGSTDPIVVDGSPETTGLIKWDISTIPSNAVVTGVTVELNVNNESDGPYELYQALQPWTESATWLTYDGSNGWGGVGATSTSLDRGTTVYGAIDLGAGNTGVETITFGPEGLALVQSWIDGSVINNGFVIQDFVTTNGVQYSSRENGTVSNRPRFTVSYYTGTPPAPGAMAWNSSDWTQYDTITVDATKVDADLTDFPVYVDLADLSTDFWTTTPTSSALVATDIRVTNSSNVELPRELVLASSTLQSGELHFKADSISSTTDTTFKIWYNGTTTGDYATNATYGAEQVWTNNYLAVYHMQDDPSGTTTDSTSNGFDGGPGGSVQASGAVGSAVNFGGASRIDVTNFTSYLTSFSAESWVRPTALENTGNLYTIIDLKDALYWAIRDTDDSVRFGTNWGSYYNWTTTASTVVDDTYQHLYVGMSDLGDTAADPVMINNGSVLSQGDNTPSGSHQQSSTNLYIGSGPGFDAFTGDIDELRISSTTRSSAWVQATYYNQATTTDFYAVNYVPPSAGVAATAVFQEGVNGYSGTTDTSISDAAPTTNYGTQNFLDIDGDTPETTGFIKWDISSIPSNAIIDAAEIVLYNVDPGDDYEFYESISAWTEGGATWNTYNGTNNWTTAGAKDVGTDIAGTVLGTFSGAGTGFATSTLNASGIALLQDWVDGTKTNHGFAIQDHLAVSGTSPASSEAVATAERPKLIVSYTIPSTATIGAHTAGQVSNAFDFRNKTDAPLFAFNLTPVNGTGTVTNTVLTLSGVQKLDAGDFSNIRLVRDHDHDAIYDVSDEAVGGSGTILINGETGTITFTGDFLATTTTDYLVVGDFNAPANGTFVTISLLASSLTVLNVASGIEVVDGTVASVQHHRNNNGGGGGNSSVDGAAPAGAGDVGGGGGSGGEVIGNNPDYFWPSSQSGSWTSGASAYDQTDGTYATTNSVANHQYADHSFVVPGSNSIQGIIVKLELSGTTGAGTVDVELSWDGGTSWSSTRSTPTLGTSDVVYTLGSPSDLWGHAWLANEFSNANFAVRVTGNVSSNTIRLDALQVRVYHVASGGGAGGGGGGGGI